MDTEGVAQLRLEKSLTLHRAKIEALRLLESKLDARITRLSELSKAAKTLIESMMSNPFQLEVGQLEIYGNLKVCESCCFRRWNGGRGEVKGLGDFFLMMDLNDFKGIYWRLNPQHWASDMDLDMDFTIA